MCIFKRKTNAQKNMNDRELIEKNAGAIGTLISIASEDMVEELKLLQEEVKYIIPLVDSKAYDIDKKIRNLIDDLKIEIVKAKEGEKAQTKISGIIRELKLKIAERKALI